MVAWHLVEGFATGDGLWIWRCQVKDHWDMLESVGSKYATTTCQKNATKDKVSYRICADGRNVTWYKQRRDSDSSEVTKILPAVIFLVKKCDGPVKKNHWRENFASPTGSKLKVRHFLWECSTLGDLLLQYASVSICFKRRPVPSIRGDPARARRIWLPVITRPAGWAKQRKVKA